MSNSGNKGIYSHDQLVTVKTDELKVRLNRFYETKLIKLQANSFDHLWDIKEMALLEGKKSVDVPSSWLEELDGALPAKH